ncbi:hypothetical protein Y032_0043g732 [Ancylostoma ceylanicum]|uniref:Uncharacterized protein n=1 Tax=Ancylostoma ceylanicum TaxID=53326 RepID=A0A016UEZ6_9BILA|nr:hypothetical protein Y032_0043g732 [Ancylostoma ceylanicum]
MPISVTLSTTPVSIPDAQVASQRGRRRGKRNGNFAHVGQDEIRKMEKFLILTLIYFYSSISSWRETRGIKGCMSFVKWSSLRASIRSLCYQLHY